MEHRRDASEEPWEVGGEAELPAINASYRGKLLSDYKSRGRDYNDMHELILSLSQKLYGGCHCLCSHIAFAVMFRSGHLLQWIITSLGAGGVFMCRWNGSPQGVSMLQLGTKPFSSAPFTNVI